MTATIGDDQARRGMVIATISVLVMLAGLAGSGRAEARVPPGYEGYASAEHVGLTRDIQSRVAWRWTDVGWRRSSLSETEIVWATPWGGGWHWVWSYRTRSWYAMRDGALRPRA